MTQNEIDQAEWENPANWSRMGFYRSDRDSRLWVPKRPRRFGYGSTPNMAKDGSATVFWGVAIVPAGLLLLWALVSLAR